ncbi:hypothetical protein [Streptomyces sp. NPDC088752]|uniref:hypothetical protein n=1 Tax=Streptomyces sp. NPDC088752 TaxID=3154963 RepID=UPI003448B231
MTTKPRPGAAPTVVHVAAHLNRAGFKLARYSERKDSMPGGARVTGDGNRRETVTVQWREDYHSAEKRLYDLGLTTFADLPAHPMEEQRVRDYAAALAPRYTVKVSEDSPGRWSLDLSARAELPARPKGLPSAAAVLRALKDSSGSDRGWNVSAVDQHDHIRIAINSDEGLTPAREVLTAHGWAFEEPAPAVEHYIIHVTGPAPDRAERVRALKASQAAQRPTAPAGAPETASAPQEHAQAAPAAQEPPADTCSVCGREECANEVCGTEPVPLVELRPPVPERHYSRNGTSFRVGMRVTYRDRTGFWNHGTVDRIERGDDGRMMVAFTVDATQVAPARRPARFMPNEPGKRRPKDKPEVWTVPLDDKDLMREQTDLGK